MKKILLKLEENILTAISLIMIWGALIYYLYRLNWLGVSLIIVLSALSFYIKEKLVKNKEEITKNEESSPIVIWPIFIYGLLFSSSLFLLITATSSAALISPWTVIPSGFFWLYGTLTAWLFFVLTRNLSTPIKLWLIRFHYFLALGIAIIIYKIGYGFDPFIHQATMELIDKKGYVDPKPLYYLGQYSFIVIVHKLSGLSIYLLNKIIVPVFAALFIPGAIFSFLKNRGEIKKAPLIILSLLALPFNIFILSTPQNLTYLWLLLIIFYSLSKKSGYLPEILALATLAIHPLSGLPALFFVVWNRLYQNKNLLKSIWWKTLNLLLWLGTALSLPLSFTVVTKQSWQDLAISLSGLTKIITINRAGTNLSNFILNFPYLIKNSWPLIFIFLALYGFIVWFKQNKNEAKLLIKTISALFIGFLLSASLSFSFLIDYEQNDYTSRLLVIICLFSLPATIISLKELANKIYHQEKIIIISALITITLFFVSALYLSYPRLDAYFNSRGYSVSEADLQAVNSIAKQTNQPYIVLANQQTSVASLKELGFDHYFKINNESIFFYPIPTGGKLYQYYLKMVNNDPSRETMKEAMVLVNVKESYFVVSKYWWLSSRIIDEAKINADTYWKINDGEIYIFRFDY